MTNTEQQTSPSFDLEKEALTRIGQPVAGTDEAGRGPWAGPVVAAAVILNMDHYPDGLNDSKKLSEKNRDMLFEQIMEQAKVGIGIADVDRIDIMNILHASLWAMAQAIKQLKPAPIAVLVDGNKAPPIDCETITVVKGDSKSLSIAAASIVAKVTRDRMMQQLAEEFPVYAWEKNKGYGTKAHIAGLDEHGVTIHHRKSFKPIRDRIMKMG